MPGLGDVKLTLVDDVDSASKLMSWLGERHENNAIGVDTETGEIPGNPKDDALNPWRGRLRTAQIGDTMHGWIIPWDRWGGVFTEAMRKWDGRVLIHNVQFDAKYLTLQAPELVLPWDRIDDTMIAAKIISPTEKAGLKEVSSKYVDGMAKYLQRQLHNGMTDNGWTWGTVPIEFPPYWQYSALDPVLCARIWDDQVKRVGPGSQFASIYELEMGYVKVVNQMEMNGLRVDLDYCEQQFEKLYKYSQSVRNWAKESYSLNIASTIQLANWFTSRGAEFDVFTQKGAPCLDKEQLELFQSKYKGTEMEMLAGQILSMRGSEKIAKSYFRNFIDKQIDGFLHPSINSLAARTSRSSVTNPAAQTLHKSSSLVRNAFLPRSEDEALISSDLDQVEFRLTACLSKDKNLIEMFKRCDDTNGDAFTELLKDMYKDPTATKKDPRRKLVKTYVYANLFGAGIEKMTKTAQVTQAEMQDVADSFERTFPGVKIFQKRMELEAQQNRVSDLGPHIFNKFGRYLPVDEGKLYAATNYAIQSTAAQIFKQNVLEIDAAGLGSAMMLPVHDEILLSVPHSDVEEAKQVVQRCMTTTDGWEVPLTSGADGPFSRWGDAVED